MEGVEPAAASGAGGYDLNWHTARRSCARLSRDPISQRTMFHALSNRSGSTFAAPAPASRLRTRAIRSRQSSKGCLVTCVSAASMMPTKPTWLVQDLQLLGHLVDAGVRVVAFGRAQRLEAEHRMCMVEPQRQPRYSSVSPSPSCRRTAAFRRRLPEW
jgi:hypothetical protein